MQMPRRIQKHYIGGAAVYTTITPAGSAALPSEVRYLHHDHLGSTEAITNEFGGVVERFSFDAFGAKRNVDTWNDLPLGTVSPSSVTNRGYTWGVLLRTSIAATVGGTTALVGGGNFINGAVSAAFVHIFNDELAGLTRKQWIKEGRTGGNFTIAENSAADGSKPSYEEPAAAIGLGKYAAVFDAAAAKYNVDPRLLSAIAFIETSHGYYDALAMGSEKSILPMNINTAYWGDAFGSRAQLRDAAFNIYAGARVLSLISNNVPPGTSVAGIATLYNNINATKVSNYGARVASFRANPFGR